MDDICWGSGDLTIQVHPHSRNHVLTPIDEELYNATGLGTIRLVKNSETSATAGANEGIKGFYVTIDRARNVWFEKKN